MKREIIGKIRKRRERKKSKVVGLFFFLVEIIVSFKKDVVT